MKTRRRKAAARIQGCCGPTAPPDPTEVRRGGHQEKEARV